MKPKTRQQIAEALAVKFWPDRFRVPLNGDQTRNSIRAAFRAGYFAGIKAAQDKARRARKVKK